VRKVVFRHQRDRPTREQGSANRVGICIVVLANLLKRSLEQVANDNALADVEIAQRIEVDSTRLTQVFMRTAVKPIPRMAGRSFSELFRRPTSIHDRCLSHGFGLIDADHPCWDVQPLCRNHRILRTFTQTFIAMEKVATDS